MAYDLEEIFGEASRRLPPDFYRLWFGPMHWAYRSLFGIWPVRRAGDGYWQPQAWRGHRQSDLRLVMAVRCGDPFDDGLGYPAWIACDPVHGLPTPLMRPRLLGARALWGPEILDLVVLDWRMARPPLRLSGMAQALGGTVDASSWADRDDEPVLVVRDVGRWLARVLDGACLPLGDANEQAGLLRGFAGGLVTETTAHGRELDALMRRAAPRLPDLFVEQRKDEEVAA